MRYLRQSTAVTVCIGPFADASTALDKTGLSIARADVLLSQAFGALGQKHSETACTEDAAGMYFCPLDATDTGTIGSLRLKVAKAGALPLWEEFTVLSPAVYDALFGTDALSTLSAQAVADALKLAPGAGDPAAGSAGALLAMLAGMTELHDGVRRWLATALALAPVGITQQQVRDALKLAPTAGDGDTGSTEAQVASLIAGLAELIGMTGLDGEVRQWLATALALAPVTPAVDISGLATTQDMAAVPAATANAIGERVVSTGITVDDALKAAWAQGFGMWTLIGRSLTLYAPDNSTPIRIFELDDPSIPTSRTPTIEG